MNINKVEAVTLCSSMRSDKPVESAEEVLASKSRVGTGSQPLRVDCILIHQFRLRPRQHMKRVLSVLINRPLGSDENGSSSCCK